WDVRVVDRTIVRQGDADIRGDRALDGDRELTDGVLPTRAEIRRAVRLRIVLVAEQVGDVDRRAPAGREADPDRDLVVALPEVLTRDRPRAYGSELVAHREVAGSPVQRLARTRRVHPTAANALERLAHV